MRHRDRASEQEQQFAPFSLYRFPCLPAVTAGLRPLIDRQPQALNPENIPRRWQGGSTWWWSPCSGFVISYPWVVNSCSHLLEVFDCTAVERGTSMVLKSFELKMAHPKALTAVVVFFSLVSGTTSVPNP